MGYIFARRKLGKIQPAPAMHTDPAQKSERAAGFMLPVRPQLRTADRKLCVG